MCDTIDTSAALVTDIPDRASQPTTRRYQLGSGVSDEIVVYLRRFDWRFQPKCCSDLHFPSAIWP